MKDTEDKKIYELWSIDYDEHWLVATFNNFADAEEYKEQVYPRSSIREGKFNPAPLHEKGWRDYFVEVFESGNIRTALRPAQSRFEEEKYDLVHSEYFLFEGTSILLKLFNFYISGVGITEEKAVEIAKNRFDKIKEKVSDFSIFEEYESIDYEKLGVKIYE